MGYSRKKTDSGGWGLGAFHFLTLYSQMGIKFTHHNFEGKFYAPVFSKAIGFTCKVYKCFS